jgi:XTP/dITP diphosphohydrolase
MREILIATSNRGKLREFATAAAQFGIEVATVPGLANLPEAREDAPTFEANACKKAEYYSQFAPDRYVLADDSGLEVDALAGAPGVRSARYANEGTGTDHNASDEANNTRLLKELNGVSAEKRTAQFVCCLAVARNGRTVACFRGELKGTILEELRGNQGFGYDPLFYIVEKERTLAELSAVEKTDISHRGRGFRKFLTWFHDLPETAQIAAQK